jgi:hypothetical protein
MKPCHLQHLLTNTIWIVPKKTLPAYVTIGDLTPRLVSDQTVWVIDSCQNGYVFGTSYTTLDGVPSAKMKIVGSITPEGDVLFSFHTETNITTGYGKFQCNDEKCCQSYKKSSKCRFLMQMNTLSTLNQGVIGVSHWSYMIPTTPKDKSYHCLPGVGISVPEFIELFN